MRHILSSYKSLSSTPRTRSGPYRFFYDSFYDRGTAAPGAKLRSSGPHRFFLRPRPRVTILVDAVSRPTPSAPSRHRIPAHSGPRDAPPTGPVHPAAVRL